MDTATVKDRIATTWEATWDRGEVDALDELAAPHFTRTARATGATMSLQELKTSIRTTREAFPDLKTEIDHLVVEGEKVAIFWHSTGTHLAPMYGVPATHKQVHTYGCNLAVLQEGRLASEEVTWDPRELLRAIGITALGDAL